MWIETMKHNRYLFAALALICAIPLFLGCPAEDPGPNLGGEQKDLPAVSLATGDGVTYFSLSTGQEVTGADINTTKWDIAFTRTRLVLTNSGDTAAGLESGGQGGVWYTDKAALGDVADTDKKGEDDSILKNYLTDKKVWVSAMGGASQTTLNVMTYVGYETGDGLSAENPLSGYQYDQKQYYGSAGMGKYSSAGKEQVYIIRHGDGTHYSKILIDYEYADSKDNWAVRYQNF
ncbi:MAG: HmuY family protein [Treponema sp.]|jgi:hypothetical protein|nr:HmuY family protein [Treponema sp.]